MSKPGLRWREALPIVARELRVASKRRATYRMRWIVALVGGLAVIITSSAAEFSIAAGQFVFWCTSVVMALTCAASGLLLTADSVSREKREGTLGLLFLTRLTSADIILGKLTVGGLTGAGVAFAGLPFLAFSLCLGSVTARELWLMSGALVFLLVYSLTLGIFVSTLFRREGIVALVFCLLMLGPLALTPLAVVKLKAIPFWLAKPNPFFPSLSVVDTGSLYFAPDLAAHTLVSQSIAIFVMLIVSFIVLRWTVRAEGASPRSSINAALSRFPRVRRAKALRFDKDPVYALSRSQGNAVALFLLCAGFYFVVKFAAPTAWDADLLFVLIMSFLPKLFVLWHASGVMAAEKQSGVLETLLTTPLTGSEVLRGKMSAIKAQIAPALLFSFIALWAISTKWWAAHGGANLGTTLIFAAMIALLIDVHSVGWIGLWLGVTARDRRRALVSAALVGLILPWVVPLLVLGMLAWIFQSPNWLNEPADVLPVALISANVMSFAIACFAMARVHDKFRSTATQTWAARGRAATT